MTSVNLARKRVGREEREGEVRGSYKMTTVFSPAIEAQAHINVQYTGYS